MSRFIVAGLCFLVFALVGPAQQFFVYHPQSQKDIILFHVFIIFFYLRSRRRNISDISTCNS